MIYHLKNDAVRFWTGSTPDETQYLIGPSLPLLLVYRFDADGTFSSKQEIDLNPPPIWNSANAMYETGSEFISNMEAQVRALMEGMKITCGTIKIKQFFDEAANLGIQVLPEEFMQYLEDPAQFSEDDKESLEAALREWKTHGRFVLVWGDEHWMSRDGEMLSS